MVSSKTQHPRIIYCNAETINTIHKWMCQFKNVYGYDFTYEDVILRSLDCLKYVELDVADAYRRHELECRHRRELMEKHKNLAE